MEIFPDKLKILCNFLFCYSRFVFIDFFFWSVSIIYQGNYILVLNVSVVRLSKHAGNSIFIIGGGGRGGGVAGLFTYWKEGACSTNLGS